MKVLNCSILVHPPSPKRIGRSRSTSSKPPSSLECRPSPDSTKTNLCMLWLRNRVSGVSVAGYGSCSSPAWLRLLFSDIAPAQQPLNDMILWPGRWSEEDIQLLPIQFLFRRFGISSRRRLVHPLDIAHPLAFTSFLQALSSLLGSI